MLPATAQQRLFFVPVMLIGLCLAGTVPADQIDLSIGKRHGEMQQVRLQVEYTGTIQVDRAGAEDKPEALPMDVRGRFTFDQQLSQTKDSLQAIRYYSVAQADIKAGKGQMATDLSSENRYVLARIRSADGYHQFQIASVGALLRQSEYELLRNPCDPLALIGLLDQESVKVGQSWSANTDSVGRLLNVDYLIRNNVQLRLKSVDKQVAVIYVTGNAKGEIDDAISEIGISGWIKVDLKTKRPTHVRVTINQSTDPGQIAPGFDGQIKLDMELEPIQQSEYITRQKLSQVMKSNKVKQSFLLDLEDSAFSVDYQPAWRIIVAEPQAAVLRYIERGELLAQCNIVQLPDRPAGNQLTLEEFKAEVQKIVSTSDQVSVTSAKQATTKHGHTALRVVVEGTESGVPIRWLYYHISNEEGTAVSVAFTLEREISDRFDKADQVFVNQVRLTNPKASEVTARRDDDSKDINR